MLYTSRDSDLTLWETPEFLLTQRHLLTHAWPSENKYVGHHDVISWFHFATTTIQTEPELSKDAFKLYEWWILELLQVSSSHGTGSYRDVLSKLAMA